MIWHIGVFFASDRISYFWIQPHLLFKYYGFGWVQPWPGDGLYLHCGVLCVLAAFIAAGFLYRVSIALFFLGYTYTFLLDAGRWVNHTYLICLFAGLLTIIPAHRVLSLDAWLKQRRPPQTVPACALWILRLQMGVVYFFAGVAKLSPDWLHGEPMRVWLLTSQQPAAILRFFRLPQTVYTFAYTSLAFDLFIVPLLLWRRTRVVAFMVAAAFHIMNSQLFPLEVFPWLALIATTLFFAPDWPRRWLGRILPAPHTKSQHRVRPLSARSQTLVLSLATLYATIQLLVPLRPFLHRGGVEWYEMEHRFCWRMLLESHRVRAYFHVTDPNSGKSQRIAASAFLNPAQWHLMGWRPDLIVQSAHYLARLAPVSGPKPIEVTAEVQAAINGRKPQLIFDQTVNLAAEPAPFGRPHWLLEIHEPLPDLPPDPTFNPFAQVAAQSGDQQSPR